MRSLNFFETTFELDSGFFSQSSKQLQDLLDEYKSGIGGPPNIQVYSEIRKELLTLRRLDDNYISDYVLQKKNRSYNASEFMAEAFVKYKHSKNPGVFATAVGQLIDEFFKR